MTYWCVSADEVYGIFVYKKHAVAEALKHLEAHKVRKVNPGFHEYTECSLDANPTKTIWVMTEFEAIMNGCKLKQLKEKQ